MRGSSSSLLGFTSKVGDMKLGGFAIWLAVLALAGCGSTPERAPAINPAIIKPHTAEPRPTPTNTPDARCVPVSEAMLQAIAAGAKEPGAMIPVSGAAVKSEDHKNLYMIAVKYATKPSASTTIGVWASQSIEPGFPVYDVGGSTATTWPKGQGQFKTQIFDDGVRVAIGCVSG